MHITRLTLWPHPATFVLLCLAIWTGCAAPNAHQANPSAALRRSPAWQNRLHHAIDALVTAQDPCLHLGVQVLSATDQKPLYSRAQTDRFIPASTVKMLTAAAALHVLGPAYRFSTQLFVDGVDSGKETARTLYLRGSGDPTLDVGALAGLASALRQSGVGTIATEIVIDDSDFDTVPWAQGWMWDDLNDGFSAPIAGVNVAGNVLTLWVSPSTTKNGPVRVLSVPEAPGYVLINPLATVGPSRGAIPLKFTMQDNPDGRMGPPSQDVAQAARATSFALAAGQQISITGTMPSDSSPKARTFAVQDPVAWAGILLKEQLKRAGVAAQVTIRRGVVPPSAVAVALHQSAPLGMLLPQFVKASNNHAMECVLKRLSVASAGAPGTFANGAMAVRKYLSEQVGVDVQALNLVDGSGASRYNLVTPAHLAATVCDSVHRFDTGPELIGSLPVAGVDGTLGRRLVDTPLRGRVRAKTGTMTGIASLTGIMQTADFETLCFSIMSDGALLSAEALRKLQDQILLLLHQDPTRLTP
jgi:D-alanyl-D-alanine carboxypeptidase/D-alanyl-D-alanine-endopeptidase (penicillin-binding protein 4)